MVEQRAQGGLWIYSVQSRVSRILDCRSVSLVFIFALLADGMPEISFNFIERMPPEDAMQSSKNKNPNEMKFK